jgi:hypothetical protein
MIKTRPFLVVLLLFSSLLLSGQEVTYHSDEKIEWEAPEAINELEQSRRMTFKGAVFGRDHHLPVFEKTIPLHTDHVKLSAKLTAVKTKPLTEEELALIKNITDPAIQDSDFYLTANLSISRKQAFAIVRILPIRKNKALDRWEKLLSFSIDLKVKETQSFTKAIQTVRKNKSVLAKGEWIKVKISEDGIYQLTYSDLVEMGFNVSVNPKHLAIFGNGGGMLPEANSVFRHDDLVENPIVVIGEDDDVFNEGDYLLFYGKGPNDWTFDPSINRYVHVKNIYDDYAYYFITALDRNGKRLDKADWPSGTEDLQVTEFIDRKFHEVDEKNLAGTGRLWLGEYFDFENSRIFEFNFPNIVPDKKLFFQGSFAAVSTSISRFKTYVNNHLIATANIMATPADGYHFGKLGKATAQFLSSDDQLILKVEYQKYAGNATGYLDYLELSAFRKLIMTGHQMMVRNEFKNGSVAKYHIKGKNLTIWDVSDPVNAQKVDAQVANDTYIFKTNIADVKKFVVFDGQEFLKPEFVEKVENQNLHAIKNIDYLIITHPAFKQQAEVLANFHHEHDGLKAEVVEVPKIYNEFSSGAQDITAIRDFVKNIYDQSDEGKTLRYLLLYGDASYDYKDRISGNTNFVPCWESDESLYIIYSVATDDYFGYLDDGEGGKETYDGWSNDKVDIGIGRLPVSTQQQAQEALDKILNYATVSEKTFGPWRNTITFVADDGDFNIHMRDAEKLATYLETTYPVYNINKIYLDGFKQISTPSGQQAPEVNLAINNRIEKGTLIFNYSGHGGELGLAHEQILKLADINSWKNFDKLAVFITATCEFSRYDDPKRVSAGEQVFLNPRGGGIALFSTSRATYAAANYTLNKAIYTDNMFEKIDGEYPAFGDIIMKSKVTGGENDKKFILLGDPALKMAYTDYHAQTLNINHLVKVKDVTDTLKAFQHITVEGEVIDDNGTPVSFDGIIYPTVYDKRKTVVTFGDQSQQETYSFWNNILFNGKASITAGRFHYEFVVPKDIGYQFGKGRISYYFNNNQFDGNGYYQDFVVGGYDDQAQTDEEGPIIQLYLNDSLFISGGITDPNPEIFAIVEDESGINTTGNGIGHDIVAQIDENPEWTYILNDYYESFLNRYDKGIIRFPLRNLEPGEHQLTLKVWDVYNNSSTSTIQFTVIPSSQMTVTDLKNYPNPFFDQTTFSFNHNQSGEAIKIIIEIYNLTGKRVKTIEVPVVPGGFISHDAVWDGRSDQGRKLPPGVYPYRLTIHNTNGTVTGKNAKLVISR